MLIAIMCFFMFEGIILQNKKISLTSGMGVLLVECLYGYNIRAACLFMLFNIKF